MNLFWSEDEKANLLEALEECGSTDINAIAKMIPTKSQTEVERALRLYERKAIRALKDDGITSTQRQAPIDCWLEFFRDNSPDTFASRDLVTALRFIKLFEERQDKNLTLCYEYLIDLMAGKAPRQLPEEAMRILMDCFENLGAVFKGENIGEEVDYIKKLQLKEVLQKTYASKRGNILGDPTLNVLKVPLKLLRMNWEPDRPL
ncbi:uncharacterized protein LOC116180491 [Photinus pyralis]|uniref:SANT domain-containing protein n=1 Tax=Photinus pyralis TaxID=7054 RepID=A0A1Y1LM38_PHOPY|nr:uncharacterized protein LOC116180491 [Photinus pyralis]